MGLAYQNSRNFWLIDIRYYAGIGIERSIGMFPFHLLGTSSRGVRKPNFYASDGTLPYFLRNRTTLSTSVVLVFLSLLATPLAVLTSLSDVAKSPGQCTQPGRPGDSRILSNIPCRPKLNLQMNKEESRAWCRTATKAPGVWSCRYCQRQSGLRAYRWTERGRRIRRIAPGSGSLMPYVV